MPQTNDEFFTGQANKVGKLSSQMGRKGVDAENIPASFTNTIEIWNCRVKTHNIPDSDSFILGNASYGVLGTSKLGLDIKFSNLISIQNSHNLFPEYFSNERFNDTDVTIADWNTGSEKILFSSGSDIAQTTSIFLGSGTKLLQTVLLSLSGSDIDNIEFTTTANGGIGSPTWESITPNISKTITGVGSDLRLNMNSNGSDAEINEFFVKYTIG